MNAIIRTLGLTLALSASGAVQAEAPASKLHAENGWIRSAPPEAPVRAGYVELFNAGERAVILNKAASPAFGVVEIHEMRDVDGVARMRRLPQLELHPGERVQLKPGGIHLMLFRPVAPLSDDTEVEVELTGPDGVKISATLRVGDP